MIGNSSVIWPISVTLITLFSAPRKLYINVYVLDSFNDWFADSVIPSSSFFHSFIHPSSLIHYAVRLATDP